MQSVSVIVAAWNAEKTIQQCIDSILIQKGVEVDVIVVDDSSTDGTWAVLNSISESFCNVKIFRNSTNQGPSYSRNFALKQACGNWIAIVDADDTIEPERFLTMVKHSMETSSDICFDNLNKVLATNPLEKLPELITDPFVIAKLSQDWTVNLYTSYNKPYISSVLIGFLKPIFRRSFLESNALQYCEDVSNSEDYLLVLECIILGAKISFVTSAFYNYFIYPASLSGKFNPSAHMKLISAEKSILDKYKGKLNSCDILSIESHISSLELAADSNLIFAAIKSQQKALALKLLVKKPKNALVHLNRLFASAASRIKGSNRRGS